MLSFRLTAGVGLIQSICNLMEVYFDVICKVRVKIKSIHLHVSIVWFSYSYHDGHDCKPVTEICSSDQVNCIYMFFLTIQIS